MPKDLDDLNKQLDKYYKELSDDNKAFSKELVEVNKNDIKLLKEISEIKKEVKDIAFKVDTMLEILNSFTIMLAEDDEDLEENYEYDSDQTWVPKDDEFWDDEEDDI